MPKVRAIDKMPAEDRAKIDEFLVDHGYGDYDELKTMLDGMGYDIARSTIGDYGKKKKDAAHAMQQAGAFSRELYDSVGGDFSAMAVASQGLALLRAQDVLAEHDFELEEVPPDKKNRLLMELMRFTSNSGRGIAQTDRWAAGRPAFVRDVSQKVAAKVAEAARKEGVTEEQAGRIGEAAASGVMIYLPDNGR